MRSPGTLTRPGRRAVGPRVLAVAIGALVAVVAVVLLAGWFPAGSGAPVTARTPARSAAPSPATSGAAGVGRPAARRALGILHRWDRRRAAAYRRGDLGALRALYLPGSSAATADVRLLRRYLHRGLPVSTLQAQVFSVRVERFTPRQIRVTVVDRVLGSVRSGGRRVRLPAEAPARRTVVLRRDRARWRVLATRMS